MRSGKRLRFVDAAQFAIRMSRDNRWVRRIELFFKDRGIGHTDADAKWFAFAETKFYVMDSEPNIIGKLNYADVLVVEVADTVVILKPEKGDVSDSNRSFVIVYIPFIY
jgi:hypothetical protein